MNIVLLGYGKMGKVIEKIALSRGHNIVARIDVNNRSEFDALTAADVDAVIEFSHPLSAYENVKSCIEKGIPVVSGTTGWLEKKPELEALTLEKGSAFFWSSESANRISSISNCSKTSVIFSASENKISG